MIDREKLEDVADTLQSTIAMYKLAKQMQGGDPWAMTVMYDMAMKGIAKAQDDLHEALTGKPEDQGSIRLQHDIYDAKQYREGIRAAYDTFNHLNTIITDRLGTQIQGYEAQGADVYGSVAFLRRMQALVRAAGQSLDKLLE